MYLVSKALGRDELAILSQLGGGVQQVPTVVGDVRSTLSRVRAE